MSDEHSRVSRSAGGGVAVGLRGVLVVGVNIRAEWQTGERFVLGLDAGKATVATGGLDVGAVADVDSVKSRLDILGVAGLDLSADGSALGCHRSGELDRHVTEEGLRLLHDVGLKAGRGHSLRKIAFDGGLGAGSDHHCGYCCEQKRFHFHGYCLLVVN